MKRNEEGKSYSVKSPLEDEVKRVQHEYCVDTLTGEHMVKMTRYARQAPVDLAASLRKDINGPIKPTAERVVGLTYLFEWYGRGLDDGLTELVPEAVMVDGEGEVAVAKAEHILQRRALQINRISTVFSAYLPEFLQGDQVYRLFTPFEVKYHGEKLQLHQRKDPALRHALKDVFAAAQHMHTADDSGLARVAITYCDNIGLSLRRLVRRPDLMVKAIGAADALTFNHFVKCRFSDMFAKALLNYNLPDIYLSELDIFPRMLSRVAHQALENYPPYAKTIATNWSRLSNSWTPKHALRLAQGLLVDPGLCSGRIAPQDAECLLDIVENNLNAIEDDLWPTSLHPSERVGSPGTSR